MTKQQTNPIVIHRNEIQGDFLVPFAMQGQMVTRSYAETENLILVRTQDASDGSEKIVAYEHPECGAFEPWQFVPTHGRRVGNVTIAD